MAETSSAYINTLTDGISPAIAAIVDSFWKVLKVVASQVREPGFYWVIQKDRPEIGVWTSEAWSLCASVDEYEDHDFSWIGDLIVEPRVVRDSGEIDPKYLTRVGIHTYGRNLYVRVRPDGMKSWVFASAKGGKRREMGLGSVEEITVERAHELAAKARDALAVGRDPFLEKGARKKIEGGRDAVNGRLTFDFDALRKEVEQQLVYAGVHGLRKRDFVGPAGGSIVDRTMLDSAIQVLLDAGIIEKGYGGNVQRYYSTAADAEYFAAESAIKREIAAA